MKKLRWAFWKFRRNRDKAQVTSPEGASVRPIASNEGTTPSSSLDEATHKRTRPAKRRIHFGIDFGTSSSKIVFRDYGAFAEERAILLLRNGSFRIPSRVCITAKELVFGSNEAHEDGESFESIKMLAAAEATGNAGYYFGPAKKFPTRDGFCAVDLAALALWFLISEGERAVGDYLRRDTEDLSIGMTMGVPMAFFNDKLLKSIFLSIARKAWFLFREAGPIGSTLAIARAKEALSQASEASLAEIAKDQVRDWIRSEGEAAMWWPFQSPAVAAGPYAIIDIGAGTSHASLFRIFGHGRMPKTGIAFLGAATVPFGMDAVDRRLADYLGLAGDCLALRGQEQSILQKSGKARAALVSVRDQIYDAYGRAWFQTYGKIKNYRAELTAWLDHKLFAIGGGSLVTALVDSLRVHPSRANDDIQPAFLDPPPDLVRADGKRIDRADLPFISVAYGLSNIGLSIPEVFTPDEVPPMPDPAERRIRLDREDIYAK